LEVQDCCDSLLFQKKNILFHDRVRTDEHVGVVQLMDREVLQEITITFLDAAIGNPSFFLNLLS